MDDESVPTHHGTMQPLHPLPGLIAVVHFAITDDEGSMVWWRQTNHLNCSELAKQCVQRFSGEGGWQSIKDHGTLHGNVSLQQDAWHTQSVKEPTTVSWSDNFHVSQNRSTNYHPTIPARP
jgi:hypothetical protein